MTRSQPPLPVPFIALNALSMPFIAGGVLGLAMPELVPPLADPAVAWSLIGVGVVLDLAAVVQLVAARRAAAP